jgi:pimeloyl-ACP methyl ester carboxylesterase
MNSPGRLMDVNGVSPYVEEHGSGDPVVLLHGWPDSGRVWRHQVPFLVSNGFRVFVPDLRGLGRSERPDDVSAYQRQHAVADVTGTHVEGPWRYEEIAEASHWIPLDAPERLNQLLLSWLR